MAPSIIDQSQTQSQSHTPVCMSKHVQAGRDDIQRQSALQAISLGTSLPGIPSFTEMDKKRRWMLEHMAGAFRVFSRKGYTEGQSGHISVRDPEDPHTFWTNPLGKHFGLLNASDMILVNYAGQPIGGNASRPANAAGFQIHSALHKARPDVIAACHTHSPYGKAWSAWRKPIEMLNQDAAIFYGEAQAVFEDFDGVVLSPEAGDRLAAALGPKGKGMILSNHGLLTVGNTVDEAAFLFTSLERSCEVQLLTEAARGGGKEPVIIDDEEAKFTFEMTSDPETLYHEFQPDLEYEEAMSNGSFKDL